MSITNRIKRLEGFKGMNSTEKLFVTVFLKENEDADTGLDRHLKETGLSKERVGHASLMGKKGLFSIDFGGYRDVRKLPGYEDYIVQMKKIMKSISSTLGPPRYR